MPYVPERESIALTLRPQLAGTRAQAALVFLPNTVQYGMERIPLLKGARILDVCRRAKLLIIGLALEAGPRAALRARGEGGPREPECLQKSELLLLFHLKMTGRFFVHPQNMPPLPHTRIVFDLGEAGSLFFDDMRTFGYCRVMLREELPAWPFWAGLGPEPLGMPPQQLAMHFARSFAGRRSSVKSVLLDQSVVAGVGNIYADESLFSAGIDPRSRAAEVPA